MVIGSGDTADAHKEKIKKISMDKSNLLPKNPARQQYCYTSVTIEKKTISHKIKCT
jgi:hypothetical protein